MRIAVAELHFYAPFVHTLKEKRMVVQSLVAKTQKKFSVSVAEVGEQDLHQSIVLGVAAIVPHAAQADSVLDTIIPFMEANTEAERVDIRRDIR